MATAARRTADYNNLYTTLLERWYNPGKAEDIVFSQTPLLWIAYQKMKRSKRLPADIAVRLVNGKRSVVQPFSYYDTVNTTGGFDLGAARFTVANYSGPIARSWQEDMEAMTPEAIADSLQLQVEQREAEFAEELHIDLYKGNSTDAKRLLGLEQWFCNVTDKGTLGSHTHSWQYRQGTNSIGGITQTAHTAPRNVGGTGWEPLVVDFNKTNLNNFQYTSTGLPDIGLRELFDLYNFTSQGARHPDLIISSNLPYRDYENAAQQKLSIERTNAFGDIDIAYDNIKFKNAIWIRDEDAVSQGADNASGTDFENGEQRLYMLNTDTWKLDVDDRADFAMTEPRTPVDQHSAVKHMLWRGQFYCVNPRYNASIYAYGVDADA